ncbi:MAG TPA: FCD domain-containing protein [Spirochaetia bacterium]|nr:FCD domain-containing protein [Spirochaetia bacterium]
MADTVEKIHQKTVVTQVMARIKELIASGTYKVNDRIPTENELAQMFGVGRSSVREAVKIFQHLGVLEARVPKGTFVCDRAKISSEAITWAILLGEHGLNEVIDLRRVIELEGVSAVVMGLRVSAPEAAAVVRRLRTIVEEMKTAAESESIEDLVQADYNFHAALIGATGNALFSSIYETLHAFMQEEIRRTYQSIRDLAEIPADHQDIIDHIVRADSADAAARHNEHFGRIRRLLRGPESPV